MSTVVLACEVMREELLRIPAAHPVNFTFLSMGLHVAPDRLRLAIASELERLAGVDRVILGFGLCGNAVAGLRSPHAPLVIPRVHDCIPVLTGQLEPGAGPALERGTFYLSGGWMEGERTLVSEHRRAVKRFGEQKALRVLGTMLGAYERFRFVRTGHPRQAALEQEAAGLAGLVKLPLEVVEGAVGYLHELVNGPWDPRRFLHVPRGEPVEAQAFSSPRPSGPL
ncbi:MAG TPA: DUF1638 domain-containing protein [Anaeromyxobacteraceae bacterium]|nr:DUF1638 domain-containing protein [Anaeromyxobacteraceae bacterium]